VAVSGSKTLSSVKKSQIFLYVVIIDSRDMLPDDVSKIGIRTGRKGDGQKQCEQKRKTHNHG